MEVNKKSKSYQARRVSPRVTPNENETVSQ